MNCFFTALIWKLSQSFKKASPKTKISLPLKIDSKNLTLYVNQIFNKDKTLALEQDDESSRPQSCSKPCVWKQKYLLSISRRKATLVDGFYFLLLVKLLVLVPNHFSFLLLENQFYFNHEFFSELTKACWMN